MLPKAAIGVRGSFRETWEPGNSKVQTLQFRKFSRGAAPLEYFKIGQNCPKAVEYDI